MGKSSSNNNRIGCFGSTENSWRNGLLKKKTTCKNQCKASKVVKNCKSRSRRGWKSTEVNLVFGSTFLLKVIADSESCGQADKN